jgi:hypothetical protein
MIYSDGPVDPETLKKRGYFLVMVSSSPKCIGRKIWDDFVPSKKLGSRKDGLIEVKKRCPDADEYIYISDNPGDDILSEETGFKFYIPEDAAKTLREGRPL